jgi:RNA polymerase sigma-70 factor (ECF subfamily)
VDTKGLYTHDEVELLRRARTFDQDALTCIYQTYHPAIYRYIYHHLGDAQVCQDLASEVFHRFLTALRGDSGPDRQLKAWLYRVAHNLIVDELRRRTHRDHSSLDGPLAELLTDKSPSPEERARYAIAGAHVRRALLQLTPEQRQVIVLKFLEGMDNSEIAEITGRTVGAVKALQFRGLDALRYALRSQDDQEPMREAAIRSPVAAVSSS